ncbi:MAG: hypothetical protein M4579_000242 [Chaenotheca gracillima]|nr:MAG: hypothetical protein M4579_000242 [Chaenotheca gracillima]
MDSLSADDPFEWTVDQVVDVLCHHSGSWLHGSSNPISPDPTLLEPKIRENDLNGMALLTGIDKDTLRDELGIKSIGHRSSILQAIKRLRSRSPKYAFHVQEAGGQDLLQLPTGSTASGPSMQSTSATIEHQNVRSPSLSYRQVQSPQSHLHGQASRKETSSPVLGTDGTGSKRSKLTPSFLQSMPMDVEIDLSGPSSQNVGVDREAPSHELEINSTKSIVTPLPGKMYRDERGRKRLVPVLQSPDDSLKPAETALPAVKPAGPSNPSEISIASDSKLATAPLITSGQSDHLERYLEPQTGYLGASYLSANDLFYGQTRIGGNTDLAAPHRISNGLVEQKDDEFQISPLSSLSTGRRLCVNRLLRRFLLNNHPKPFFRNGQRYYAMQPYSDMIGREQSNPSFTLFTLASNDNVVVTRESIANWPEVSVLVTGSVSAGELERAKEFYKIQDSSAPVPEHSSEWDYLLKWNYASDHESGEVDLQKSSSNLEYDSETLNEMEEEMEERKTRENKKSSVLTLEEVQAAIDLGISDITQNWKDAQLPKLEPKARQLWRQSRRLRNKAFQIMEKENRIRYLNDKRLVDLRKNLAEERWTSALDLRRKCGNMEQSLFDREKLSWEISVLKSQIEPPRMRQRRSTIKEKTAPPPVTGLEEDDVEVLESNSESFDSSDAEDPMDTFVIQDEHLDGLPNLAERADEELIGGEADQMDLQQDDDSDGYIARPSLTEQENFDDHGHNARDRKRTRPILEIESSPLSSPMTISEPQFLDGPSRVIDLTERTDSSEPEEVLRQSPIRTPPINQTDDNPFARGRKAVGENYERGSRSPSEEIDEENFNVGYQSEEKMGSYSDLETIDTWSYHDLAKFGDRRRFLLKFLKRMRTTLREHVIERMTQVGEQDLRVENEGILEAIRKNSLEYKGMDQDTYVKLRKFAFFYLFWYECRLRKVGDNFHTFPDDVLVAAKAANDPQDPASFHSFYRFLQFALRRYGYERPAKTQEKGNDAGGTAASLMENSHKKRKREVLENVHARSVRENDRERLSAYDARRRELESRLPDMDVNVAGDSTRIVVNPGKFDDQDFIYINPRIGKLIKPHQIEGVRFMWREVVTDQKSLQGCLLAHTMGLGKTMQVITLLVTIAEAAKSPNPKISSQIPRSLKEVKTLILCPPSLIDNWCDEIVIWAPRPFEDTIGQVYRIDTVSKNNQLQEITNWNMNSGILIISYDRFRTIMSPPRKPKTSAEDGTQEMIRDLLLKGPQIIVADEAHKLKNTNSQIARLTARFKSKSRIALTGSPLANNLEEYHSMIDWVAPGYLGPLVEFRSKYVEPIQEGLYIDSSASERRLSMKMLHVLKMDLEPKVRRADISVIEGSLPQKTEFVIKVPLTKVQEDAYRLYIDSMLSNGVSDVGNTRLWDWLAILSLLCNHPYCFREKLLEREQKHSAALGTREAGYPDNLREEPSGPSDDEPAPTFGDVNPSKVGVSGDLVRQQLALFKGIPGGLNALEHSHKVKIFNRILDLAKAAGDKTLVFSHSLTTLDYLEGLFKQTKRKYERLDGKTKMADRQQATKKFNMGTADVYLVSTRAGGLGLNLYGANRVIIFDFNFNPSWEEQAVGRAYRLGQKKAVFVYRFIAGGTFEEVIHNKAVFKLQLALNVVDKRNVSAVAEKSVREYLFPPRTVPQKDLTEFEDKDVAVLGKILARPDQASSIRSIELTETFRRDALVQITDEDRKEADQLLKDRQLERSDPEAYNKLIRERLEKDMAQAVSSGNQRLDHTGFFTPQKEVHSTTVGRQKETPVFPPSKEVHSTSLDRSKETLVNTPGSKVHSTSLGRSKETPIYPPINEMQSPSFGRSKETPVYPPGHEVHVQAPRTQPLSQHPSSAIPSTPAAKASTDSRSAMPIPGATTHSRSNSQPSSRGSPNGSLSRNTMSHDGILDLTETRFENGKNAGSGGRRSEMSSPSLSGPTSRIGTPLHYPLSEQHRQDAMLKLASRIKLSVRTLIQKGELKLAPDSNISPEANRLAKVIVKAASSLASSESEFRANIDEKIDTLRDNLSLVQSIWEEEVFLNEFSRMNRIEVEASMDRRDALQVTTALSDIPAGPRRDMAIELQTGFTEMITDSISKGHFKLPENHTLGSIAAKLALAIEGSLVLGVPPGGQMTPDPYPRKGRLVRTYLQKHELDMQKLLKGELTAAEIISLAVEEKDKAKTPMDGATPRDGPPGSQLSRGNGEKDLDLPKQQAEMGSQNVPLRGSPSNPNARKISQPPGSV